MAKTYLAAIVALALLSVEPAASQAPEEVKGDNSSDPPGSYYLSDVVISLERTGCLGRCPTYRVEIRGDGRVTYTGRHHVAETGRREARMDAEIVLGLLNHIYEIRFFDMEGVYRTGRRIHQEGDVVHETEVVITDLPSKIITVRIGEYEKRVEDYAYSPRDLVELSPMIDQVAGTDRGSKR